MKTFERLGRWLDSSVSAAWMDALGRPAPVALFLAFLAVHLARKFARATMVEQSRVEEEERRLQASLLPHSTPDTARPAVHSDSVQSLLSLTEKLLASRSYRGARWEADWADQGLNLCAELEELERTGRLDPHQIQVSHRFIDECLRLRPRPGQVMHH